MFSTFVYQSGWSVLAQNGLQLISIIALLGMLWRYRQDTLMILLNLYCFPRVFEFFGATVFNGYKILIFAFCLTLFFVTQKQRVFSHRDRYYGLFFLVFSLYFIFVPLLFMTDSPTLIFSQWARYAQIFMLFFLLRDAVYNKEKKDYIVRFFLEIMVIQIVFSVCKFAFLGFNIQEGLVGSFAIMGGGLGTIIPIVGFIVLWLYRKGHLVWYDVFYVFGLLFIGFTSYKRAIILLLPLLILFFLLVVQRKSLNTRFFAIILLIISVLYVGIRLMPSLNPERKIWGSFDLPYALEITDKYQFGGDKMDKKGTENGILVSNDFEGSGRGGATFSLLRLLFSPNDWTDEDVFGYGLSAVYASDEADFSQMPFTLSIDRKGSATGFVQTYIAIGFVGCLLLLLAAFFPFSYSRHKRLKWTLIALVAWDFFFYSGLFVRTPVCMVVLFLAIFYLNDTLVKTPLTQ